MTNHLPIVAFTAVAVAAFTFWISAQLNAPPPPWDPIGEFPVQTVLQVTDEFVEIEGTKCYDEAVQVVGAMSWRSVDPLGTTVEVGNGSVRREVGCLTQTFENSIPPEVRAAVDRGVTGWVINGSETPVDDIQGRNGVPRGWTTERFDLD